MGKKISAIIDAPGHEPYRAYFQEAVRENGERMVLVWRAGEPWAAYSTKRFNNGVFSRDWVRSMYGNRAEVFF